MMPRNTPLSIVFSSTANSTSNSDGHLLPPLTTNHEDDDSDSQGTHRRHIIGRNLPNRSV